MTHRGVDTDHRLLLGELRRQHTKRKNNNKKRLIQFLGIGVTSHEGIDCFSITNRCVSLSVFIFSGVSCSISKHAGKHATASEYFRTVTFTSVFISTQHQLNNGNYVCADWGPDHIPMTEGIIEDCLMPTSI